MIRFGEPIKVKKEDNLEKVNIQLKKTIEELLLLNLKATNRSIEEEKNSHMES